MARGRETDTQEVAALIVKGNRGVFLRYKWPPSRSISLFSPILLFETFPGFKPGYARAARFAC